MLTFYYDTLASALRLVLPVVFEYIVTLGQTHSQESSGGFSPVDRIKVKMIADQP